MLCFKHCSCNAKFLHFALGSVGGASDFKLVSGNVTLSGLIEDEHLATERKPKNTIKRQHRGRTS